MDPLPRLQEFGATLEKSDDAWTFRVKGAGAGARTARLFILNEVPDVLDGGTRIDEELVFQERFEPKAGSFDLGSFRRRPYSTKYRIRFGEKNCDVTVEGDLAAEIRERGAELAQEFERVRGLFGDLRHEYLRLREKLDPAAWKRWLDPWMDQIEELKGRNEDRWGVWAIWIEGQGKLRIEGLARRLTELAVDCREALEGRAPAPAKMSEFLDALEEAVMVAGVELPLDKEAVRAALAEYEKTRSKAALLALAEACGGHRRAYWHVRRILDAKEDAEAREKAIKEFRAFAGL